MTTGGGHPDDGGRIEPTVGPGPRTAGRHPATAAILRWFEYGHLPPHLQAVSKPVGDLAHELVELLPDGPELTTGLRKLLEAKDCLVRSALDVPPEQLVSSRGGAGHPRMAPERCPATIDGRTFGDPDRLEHCVEREGHGGPHRYTSRPIA